MQNQTQDDDASASPLTRRQWILAFAIMLVLATLIGDASADMPLQLDGISSLPADHHVGSPRPTTSRATTETVTEPWPGPQNGWSTDQNGWAAAPEGWPSPVMRPWSGWILNGGIWNVRMPYGWMPNGGWSMSQKIHRRPIGDRHAAAVFDRWSLERDVANRRLPVLQPTWIRRR